MATFYNSVSPEELQIAAEKAGLGGNFPIDFLEFKKELTPGWKILEVGCGTGRLGMLFMDQFDYYGIDIHQPYLNFFKKVLKKSGKRGNLIQESFDKFQENDFNAILFPWTVIGDFDNQKATLKKACDMLKQEGLIILDNPARGTEYNVHKGYNPKRFYFSDWVGIFKKVGFKKYISRIYNTPEKKKRELVLLYK